MREQSLKPILIRFPVKKVEGRVAVIAQEWITKLLSLDDRNPAEAVIAQEESLNMIIFMFLLLNTLFKEIVLLLLALTWIVLLKAIMACS